LGIHQDTEESIGSTVVKPPISGDQQLFGLGEKQVVKYDFKKFREKRDQLIRRLNE